MKILVDMNLSPSWVPVLSKAGHEPLHWSQVGAPDAPDRVIMDWARAHGYSPNKTPATNMAGLFLISENQPALRSTAQRDEGGCRLVVKSFMCWGGCRGVNEEEEESLLSCVCGADVPIRLFSAKVERRMRTSAPHQIAPQGASEENSYP